MSITTRHEFELLAAAAALAGMRNPREDQFVRLVQLRAQKIADAFEERGYFQPEGAPQRFHEGPMPTGPAKRGPVVQVGSGKPGEGVGGRNHMVVDQTAGNGRPVRVDQTRVAPGKGMTPPVVSQRSATPAQTAHQSSASNVPKPRLIEPKKSAPTVVGGAPQPRLVDGSEEG